MSEDLDAVDFHYFIEAFERQWTHFGLAFVNLAIMRGRLPLGRLYRCAWGVIERRARSASALSLYAARHCSQKPGVQSACESERGMPKIGRASCRERV